MGYLRAPDPALAVSALQQIPLPLVVLDNELRVVYANGAAQALVDSEPLTRRFLPEIHPDFAAAQLEAACRGILAGGSPAVLRFLQSSTGHWYDVHLAAVAEGGVVALWQSTSDVHDLKQRLLAAEERFQRIFDASAAGLAIGLLDGRLIQVNEAFARTSGYSRAELVGRTFRSITYPDDPCIELPMFAQRDHSDLVVLRNRLLTKAGELVWVRNTVSLIRDAAGEPVHLLALCENINDQYVGEQKLRASEWRFRSLIESTTDVIMIVLPDGTTSYVSPSMERALGYRPDECVGVPVLERVHPDDLPAVRREFSGTTTMYGKSMSLEFRVQHKDGSWRTMEVTGRNLIHNPVIGGLVLSWRDVTERVEARSKIREYSTELERQHMKLMETLTDSGLSSPRLDLLTSIAEEIRTPIIGIGGITDLLLETRLEPAQRECAQRIRDSTQNLLSVVDGFLRISGAETAGE
jgi:PAS domain S-box-containing protein